MADPNGDGPVKAEVLSDGKAITVQFPRDIRWLRMSRDEAIAFGMALLRAAGDLPDERGKTVAQNAFDKLIDAHRRH